MRCGTGGPGNDVAAASLNSNKRHADMVLADAELDGSDATKM